MTPDIAIQRSKIIIQHHAPLFKFNLGQFLSPRDDTSTCIKDSLRVWELRHTQTNKYSLTQLWKFFSAHSI